MEGFPPSPHRKTALGKDDCWFYYGLDVVNTSIASYILAEAKLVDMHVVVRRRLPPSRRDYFVVLLASGNDACQLRHDDRRPPILEASAASDVNQLDLIVMVSDSVDVWLG